jgi:uncharacterized protein YdeI (YjbR/CyaY-like superfamily)
MELSFFETPADFRAWFEANHDTAAELLVGYYKKGSSRPSINWPESVDQALCFGWIDGVRRSRDDESYTIRFTPCRRGSNWSEVNTKRAFELIDQGLMTPAGLTAFEARDPAKTALYSHEERGRSLDEPHEAQLREDGEAWAFWQTQPSSYRGAAAWYVMSAKKEETRQRRLAQLIADSAAGRRLPILSRPAT